MQTHLILKTTVWIKNHYLIFSFPQIWKLSLLLTPGAQGFSTVPRKGLSVAQVQKTQRKAPPELRLKSKWFYGGLVPGRVLGSDKDYVSSEEGSRDPRKGTGVTVQASLRRGVFAIQQAPCHKAPFSWLTLSSQGNPFQFWRREKGRRHSTQLWENKHVLGFSQLNNRGENPSLKASRTWGSPEQTPWRSLLTPVRVTSRNRAHITTGQQGAVFSKQSWWWRQLVFLLGSQLEILEGTALCL